MPPDTNKQQNNPGNRPNVNPGCSFGAVTREKTDNIANEVTEIMDWLRRVETKVDNTLAMAMKRPGWTVLVIITALSSLSVGLIVTLVRIKVGG